MNYVVMRLKDSYSLDSYNEIRPYLKKEYIYIGDNYNEALKIFNDSVTIAIDDIKKDECKKFNNISIKLMQCKYDKNNGITLLDNKDFVLLEYKSYPAYNRMINDLFYGKDNLSYNWQEIPENGLYWPTKI
ncbi:hypothetical protein DWZ11_01230 [Megamonas rupellensis]|uniref:Uncharacterized protein n=1 Tax=Megamonas rupellensis TaxID=491921 RepID=A0A412A099_9FIRM|nr:hypothetical protein [Megamonas rupellensis]RGQ08511.1 hypothetical protein DWZ11_01230 [Megamonas rupellensis]